MRNRYMPSIFITLGTLTVLQPFGSTASANSPVDIVNNYVDAQTFLVGRIDIRQIPATELREQLLTFLRSVTDDTHFLTLVESSTRPVVQLRDAFIDAGGREIYLFVSTADIPFGPPYCVVTCSDKQHLGALKRFVQNIVTESNSNTEVREGADNRLLIGTKTTVNRVLAQKVASRPQMAAAWKSAGSAPIQLVLAPSQDHHRVLREMFPQLPAPWETLTGAAISDAIQWATLSGTMAPEIRFELLIESKNDAAAQHMKALIVSSLTTVARLPQLKDGVPGLEELVGLLTPQVAGKQIHIRLQNDPATMKIAMKPLVQAITAARNEAKRQQSMNNLKQIMLAMHNYHDVHRRFPPRASRDHQGRPLLSWRVLVLPFIDRALYKRFKLDEPWNSEHNRKLIPLMPQVYADPNADLKPGMTAYLAPVGEGTAFGGSEGIRLRDFKHGTSKTLMIVSAPPEKAVIWTKPDDLPVTQTDVKKELFGPTRREFIAVAADGAAHVLMDSIADKTLWRLLDASDGTPILDWP